MKSGLSLRVFIGHTKGITSAVLSSDGKRAVSGSIDGTMKVWDTATGKELRTINGHEDVVTSVAVSPDGKWILSGSADTTVKLWDAASGKELRTLTGHTERVNAVAFAPDGKSMPPPTKMAKCCSGTSAPTNRLSHERSSVIAGR